MRRVVLHFQPGEFDVYGGLLRLLPTGCLDRPGCRISQASVSDVYQQLAWRDEVARRRGNTEYGVRGSLFAVYLASWHKVDSEVTPVSPGRRTAFSPTSFFCNKGEKKKLYKVPCSIVTWSSHLFSLPKPTLNSSWLVVHAGRLILRRAKAQ